MGNPTHNHQQPFHYVHLAADIQAIRRGRPSRPRQRRPLLRQARRHCRDHRPREGPHRRPRDRRSPPGDRIQEGGPHPIRPQEASPGRRADDRQQGLEGERCAGKVGAERAVQSKRRSLSDFDRFKVQLLKTERRKVVSKEMVEAIPLYRLSLARTFRLCRPPPHPFESSTSTDTPNHTTTPPPHFLNPFSAPTAFGWPLSFFAAA